mgnify:CR=1 FL=1|jgi:hypothetical protein
MIFSMPPAPPQYSSATWNQILDNIRKAFIPLVSKDEAVARLLLRAPNGTIYEVTVDNSGTLQTAVNDGKDRNL